MRGGDDRYGVVRWWGSFVSGAELMKMEPGADEDNDDEEAENTSLSVYFNILGKNNIQW